MDLLELKRQLTCVCCDTENHDKCIGLEINKCPGKCKFYKNNLQKENAQKKVNSRLRRLPEVTQKLISEKYYLGLRPWVNDGRV